MDSAKAQIARTAGILACLWLACLGMVAAQSGSPGRPHLAVLSFTNESGLPAADAACSGATKALILTLRQLNLYELVPGGGAAIRPEQEALRAWAEAHNADYILFGAIASGKAGALVCGLSLFDRSKGRITVARHSEEVRPLDVFDASDELIATVLNEVTGQHIGFGRVVFRPSGEKGSYKVLLDGMDAGADLKSIETVLMGSHTIAVTQRRMLGDYEVLRRTLTVAEGDEVDLDFAVPGLTPEERAKVEGLEAGARTSWEDPLAEAAVDSAVEELAALTRDSSYSQAILPYQKRAKQLAGEWQVRKNSLEIWAKAWDPGSELLDPSLGAYLSARSYPDPEAIRAATRANASVLATLLELKAAKLAAEGKLGESMAVLESILDFSRYLPDQATSQYASAIAGLKELQGLAPGDRSLEGRLKALYGPRLEAAIAFYALRQDSPTGPILLPSDQGQAIGLDGGQPSPGPRLLAKGPGSYHLSLPGGKPGPGPSLSVAPGARLVYLDLGSPGFGSASLVAAAISQGKGRLSIDSEPQGMRIVVDDSDEQLELPQDLDLVAGAHKFKVLETQVGGGYYEGSEAQWITIQEGATLRISLKPKPNMGSLYLRLVPDGLDVYIRDKLVGRTPLEPFDVQTGNFQMAFKKDGATVAAESMYLYSGENETFYWGRRPASPIVLTRRTIKLDGKADSWVGIPALFVSENSSFMGERANGIEAFYLCRDDKYYYWRVDYREKSPIYKLPKGVSYGVQASFNVNLTASSGLDISVSNRSGEASLLYWSGIWSNSAAWKDLGNKGISYKDSPSMLVVRARIQDYAPYLKGIIGIKMVTANVINDKWAQQDFTSNIYIDFDK